MRCKPLAMGVRFAIQTAGAGDQHDQAARANQFDRLAEEPVVDQPVGVWCLARVVGFEVPERNVSNDQVEEPQRQLRLFKPTGVDLHPVGSEVGLQQRGADRIFLHGGNRRFPRHGHRHRCQEVPDTGCRFDDPAALEAEVVDHLPDRLDQIGRRVERRVDAGLHRGVLRRRDKRLQPVALNGHTVLRTAVRREHPCCAAPAGVAQELRHFCGGGLTFGGGQLLHQDDGANVVVDARRHRRGR